MTLPASLQVSVVTHHPDRVLLERTLDRLATAIRAAQEIDVLRSHLLEHLPDYMVPALFVHLDALPLSPNGKLDRKALPAPDQGALPVREYEAPVGEVEITLARLWAELLNVERVGRHDHFFELGGHSLLAVSLIGRLRQEGMEADVRSLFEHPTLAGYAAQGWPKAPASTRSA